MILIATYQKIFLFSCVGVLLISILSIFLQIPSGTNSKITSLYVSSTILSSTKWTYIEKTYNHEKKDVFIWRESIGKGSERTYGVPAISLQAVLLNQSGSFTWKALTDRQVQLKHHIPENKTTLWIGETTPMYDMLTVKTIIYEQVLNETL